MYPLLFIPHSCSASLRFVLWTVQLSYIWFQSFSITLNWSHVFHRARNAWKRRPLRHFTNKMFWKILAFSLFPQSSVRFFVSKTANKDKSFSLLKPLSNLPPNCLSVFGHFVGLALKGLISSVSKSNPFDLKNRKLLNS